MEAVVQPVIESPHQLAWFRQFLKEELAPYPGRDGAGRPHDDFRNSPDAHHDDVSTSISECTARFLLFLFRVKALEPRSRR